MRQEGKAMRDLSKMLTWIDGAITRGKEAGLPPEKILEAVQNRLGLGAGMRSVDAGGAARLTAVEQEEHGRLYELALKNNGLDEVSAARLAMLDARAYGQEGGEAA
jgi:hypothetical protein